ncbi:hypothetical protein PCE31106_00788 [Pandoraea cepalis]|uniref:Uncharacterized protein n=1 Tax=Pandoraea cepalis TaxID=2508294 RepID=A0A5E4SIM1_9BURK|nr:hypothetical protein PCE31106_00788 [Pandoraea cepalis]
MYLPWAFPEKPLIIQKKPLVGKRRFPTHKKNPNLMGPG